MKMQYKVISGIFEGTVFDGYLRGEFVYNEKTIGQIYPSENCIYVPSINNIELINHPMIKGLKQGDLLRIKRTNSQYTFFTKNSGKKVFFLTNYKIAQFINNQL